MTNFYTYLLQFISDPKKDWTRLVLEIDSSLPKPARPAVARTMFSDLLAVFNGRFQAFLMLGLVEPTDKVLKYQVLAFKPEICDIEITEKGGSPPVQYPIADVRFVDLEGRFISVWLHSNPHYTPFRKMV